MIFNLQKLEQAIADGYVAKRKHPSLNLYILNYTAKTQYEWKWDETTVNCRGLIVDDQYRVVERPFKKFFTIDQLTQLRNYVHNLYGLKFSSIEKSTFRSFEKMDGSLGVLYWDHWTGAEKVPMIATRGSFESDQAKKGCELIQKYNCTSLNRNYTYLFEIVYPENRIVVNYGSDEKLVLIAVIDKLTGADAWWEYNRIRQECIFPVAQEYPISTFKELEEAAKVAKDNFEGYVLVFENGFRLKFKYDEYKRLHRLLTGVSERTVWDMLSTGADEASFLEQVPDEFYTWYTLVKNRLLNEYLAIERSVSRVYQAIEPNLNRKLFAQQVFGLTPEYKKYSGMLFKLYDGKEIAEDIWKLVYPDGNSSVFKIQSADAD